ncbi:MAG: NFACT RNA binding domain-containing protein [Bacillota bacterium]
MPFDGLVLNSVTRELNALITGGRVERVYQPAALEIILAVRSNREKHRLFLSAAADAARVHLTETDRRNPAKIAFFCSTMRRHVEGSRITAITQQGLDRILHIELKGTDELGRPVTHLLIAEIMGKHSNIILLNPAENKIIDAIKRYSHAVSRYREVLPGQVFTPSPPSGKADPRAAAEDDFIDALSALGPQTGAATGIQRLYEGFSLFSAREVARRAGLDPDAALEGCGIYEYRRLHASLRELVDSVTGGGASPTLILKGETPADYAAFEPSAGAGQPVRAGMNEVLDRFYRERNRAAAFAAQKHRIEQCLTREIGRLNRKLENVETLLSDPEPDRFRMFGELLTANLYRLGPHVDEAICENVYNPDAPPVTIPLDPALTPGQNAQRYFKKYAKARTARRRAADERQRLEEEIAYLSGISVAGEQASGLEDLTEVVEELAEQGYLQTGAAPHKKDKKEEPRPLKLASAEGFVILIGKNNRQNDYVTFRMAAADDIWLHARGVPGAHVIIKTGGGEPSPGVLAEAAALAAHFSQGRRNRSVPVDWTRRANVQRPKGARPGFVTYSGEKTIHGDPSLAGALLIQPE